jgi:2-(1,2-epoxy-1,2-dihydrophenyl)acetyl-CoA isomerase
MGDLDYDVRDGVGLITLNRPEKANALSEEMILGLADVYTEAEHQDEVRVLVLTGAGRHFCSGGDVKRPMGEGPAPQRGPAGVRASMRRTMHRIPRALRDLDKPVIAAVNGAAVGAGMDIALMCDMRVAARSARFSEAFVRAGLIPGGGSAYFLPRLVGPAKALELLLTGDMIGAEEAHELGIVNRIYEDDGFLDAVLEFAGRIAASPPVHIQLVKRAVYSSVSASLDESLELVSNHMAIVQSMEDSVEARAAWLEKRPGVYQGR